MPISNPTEIPGCILWLDAADPTTLFQDNAGSIPATHSAPVRLWRDKSSRNNHFNNPFTNLSPILSARGVQNNLSAVFFDNTFTEFLTGDITGYSPSTSFRFLSSATIISVCQPLSGTTPDHNSAIYWGFGNLGSGSGSFTANRGITLNSANPTTWNSATLSLDTIAINHQSSTATTGGLAASTYRRYNNIGELLTVTITTTGTTLYQNGRVVPLNLSTGITTTTNTSPTAAQVSDNRLILNGARVNGSVSCGGQNNWFEFLIYDRVLTPEQRQDVTDYIRTKWALSDPIYNGYGIGGGAGNWSQPSTWLNNTLPTIESDVWANNTLINIDTNINVLSLRTTTFTSGGFEVKTPININLYGEGVVAGATTCVTSYLGGTDLVTINGRVTGSNTTTNRIGVLNAETGIVRCISPGGVRAGTQSGSHGASTGDVGSVFIVGPCYGSDGSATSYGVHTPYNGYINVTGDIIAGLLSPGLTFQGDVEVPCTIRVTGNIFASSGSNALVELRTTASQRNTVASIQLCSSFRTGSTGWQAVDLSKFLLLPKPYSSYTKHLSANNSPIVQYSAVDDYTIYLHPEAKDTLLGTLYGALGLSGIPFQLKGTMGVPDRTAVAYGTLVGTTIGVGIIDASSLQSAWTAPLQSIKIKNSIGDRAYNAAQISEFGNLLTKLNI